MRNVIWFSYSILGDKGCPRKMVIKGLSHCYFKLRTTWFWYFDSQFISETRGKKCEKKPSQIWSYLLGLKYSTFKYLNRLEHPVLLRRSVISGAGYRGYSATDLSIFAAKTAAHQEYTDIYISRIWDFFKITVDVILSAPLFVEWHVLFTTVPLKQLVLLSHTK